MMMYNPPHPGEVLNELCLQPLGLSVTRAAKALGITRKTLSQLLNGHAGVSPIMALRLAMATDTTPESWLNMQTAHDLWQAKQKSKQLKVQRLEAA
ncbi:MAG: HigA family addiction module antidote protein [Nitrospirae bacterium]|nr:HigA family addiction module antidote protein [Nitrospirota bacterium]